MIRPFAAAALILSLSSCSGIYYGAMKKLGKEKRDILVNRLVSGQKAQDQAKEQIKTTLEAFQELTGFNGGDLEKVYKKLDGELQDADGRAKNVSEKIDSIEKVGNDLFKEWGEEIAGMRNASLRNQSQTLLRQTQRRHQQHLRTMRITEEKMTPVLRAFRDQVTFLKHNLNAKAIASLKQTAAGLDKEVADLVKDLEASVNEADAYIATLSKESD
jgi:ElaB/YqjD/DUF883 family membrane-anchored ribosome-binding protein